MQLLQLHLRDSASACLNNLGPDSIGSWEELRQIFIANFRGTSKRTTSFEELGLCVQRTGEPLHLYILHWQGRRNSTKNISKKRAIDAFSDGLLWRDFRETLGRVKPKTSNGLMSLSNEWAHEEDFVQNPRHHRSPDEGEGSKDLPNSGIHRVHQRGQCNRYTITNGINMVAEGFTNTGDNDNHDSIRHGDTYYNSSSQSTSYDNRSKPEWRRHRD
jgi:hypothetical protein